MRAVLAIVRAMVARRRLQTLVLATVTMLATGTVVLGIGLLVASDAPFDKAFASQAGAHATASFAAQTPGARTPGAQTSDAALRAAAQGVTAMAGPFEVAEVSRTDTPGPRTMSVVGRADQNGAVDRLTLDSGRWLTGPGQVVLARHAGAPPGMRGPDTVTLGGVTLTVVGVASSITHSADAWVWPTETGVLHAAKAQRSRQVLYRFAAAGSDAELAASLRQATAALPAGTLLGSASYLVAKRDADSSMAPVVPFVVAFAVLGLVLSVLIVANVVSGAVVTGYRTIGVLKSVGFSPGQVVAGYAGATLVPGTIGCLLGIPLGNLLAVPLLAQTDRAYDVGAVGRIAGWVDLLAGLGLPLVIALAAVAPAARAGRFSAARAVAVGRAPRAGRGQRVRRLLAAARLPLPLRFGLGTPFARPARTAVTLLAVLLGAGTVVFATGLASSLNLVAAADTRTDEVPIVVPLPGGPGSAEGLGPVRRGTGPDSTVDRAAVLAAIKAQPGTARVVGELPLDVRIPGVSEPVTLDAYDGDSTWLGIPLISGRWYSGPDEVVAGSALLRSTGHHVGDTLTLSTDQGRRQVRVVGEALAMDFNGMVVIGGAGTLTGLVADPAPNRYDIGLTAGTDPSAYADKLTAALGRNAPGVFVRAEDSDRQGFVILLTLIGTLTLLLATVAALGVFNTALLNTRERVHEIGVLKSLGMTPGQVRATVIASLTGVGLVAGVIATPLGQALHHWILPAMAAGAGLGLPSSIIDVYRPAELVALAGAGVVLAVLGALVPATWAAQSRIATALRSE